MISNEKIFSAVQMAHEAFHKLGEFVAERVANEHFSMEEFLRFMEFAVEKQRQCLTAGAEFKLSDLKDDAPIIVNSLLSAELHKKIGENEVEDFLEFVINKTPEVFSEAPPAPTTAQYENGVKMTAREIQFAEYVARRFNTVAWLRKNRLTLVETEAAGVYQPASIPEEKAPGRAVCIDGVELTPAQARFQEWATLQFDGQAWLRKNRLIDPAEYVYNIHG